MKYFPLILCFVFCFGCGHPSETQVDTMCFDLDKLSDDVHFSDLFERVDLIPLERGSSGRIIRLKIVGERATFTVGKELEIRRTLSESHLYSSAFVVDKEEVHQGIPGKFSLIGAGWGHGVGLCQIGAAMMATKGYSYREILSHYFPGAVLEKRY